MTSVRISSLLGILGASWTIYQSRNFSKFFSNPMGKMILALAFSDMLNAFVGIFGRWPELNKNACVTQGVAMYLANLSSAALALGLALNALYIVNFKGNTSTLSSYQNYYIAFSFIGPTIGSIAPLFFKPNFYGPSDLWCWIGPDNNPIDKIYFFYMILWSVILLNIISFGITWIELKKEISSKNNSTRELLMRLILGFTISIVVSWIPGTANRINNVTELFNDFIFTVAQGLVQPLRGLFNAFAFHYTMKSFAKKSAKTSSKSFNQFKYSPEKQKTGLTIEIPSKETTKPKTKSKESKSTVKSLSSWIDHLQSISVPAKPFDEYMFDISAPSGFQELPTVGSETTPSTDPTLFTPLFTANNSSVITARIPALPYMVQIEEIMERSPSVLESADEITPLSACVTAETINRMPSLSYSPNLQDNREFKVNVLV
ncbi:hypothetical protein HK103_004530 [Boothiomyces macroporosus]|uniref:G-protein coupled receptors family 2 profile 2 domain-containing protein n=1 Tax=Boothiomyces macroporosus TaxID=261099 RepID=A0AAD5UGG9_9FUNG|nr:hypothetical protein HK103_004530 [Boothiomyces macroporosus]